MQPINFIKNLISRNKPIYLDAYTNDKYVYEYHSITESKQVIPTWWKNLPALYNSQPSEYHSNKPSQLPTMKHCPGFVDVFKHTLSLPMWSNLTITTKKQVSVSYNPKMKDNINFIDGEPHRRGDDHFSSEDYFHIELDSPWMFTSSDKSINWYFSPAIWNFSPDIAENIHFLPGILNFNVNHLTNPQFFIKKESYHEVFIPEGTPIFYIVPMTEREVVVRTHYDSKKFMELITLSGKISFSTSYQKKKRLDSLN